MEDLMWQDCALGPLLFRQGTGVPVAVILVAFMLAPLFRRNAFTIILAIIAIEIWLFFGVILHGIDC
jgi:hypothetical protein